MSIILRSTKGSALSSDEVDGNFSDLDGRIGANDTAISNGDSSTLASAKSYADTQDASNLASGKAYTDTIAAAKAALNGTGKFITIWSGSVGSLPLYSNWGEGIYRLQTSSIAGIVIANYYTLNVTLAQSVQYGYAVYAPSGFTLLSVHRWVQS